MLDEIDSGLDIDAIDILRQYIDRWRQLDKTIILITHNFHLLDSIDVDRIIVMRDGQIEKEGDRSLVEAIRTE
jgi:Fe-S cluster assembly ATP-binding protein